MRRHMLLAGVALSLLTGSAAFAQGSSQGDGEQLVVAAGQFLTNSHPLIQVNNTKRATIGYGILPLTAVDGHGNNVCVLCDDLPTLENGKAEVITNADGSEGLKVTFTLKDMNWGDGTPVTTDDVLFTYQMAMDPNIGFSNFTPWTRATGIEAVDDKTFIVTLDSLSPDYNSWDQILPAHLERPVYEANPNLEAFTRQSLYNLDPTNPGLWNGPYVLTEFQLGTLLVWEPNPHWTQQPADIERIVLSFRDNAAALTQAVLAGEIDLAPIVPGGVDMERFLEIMDQHPDRFQYYAEPGSIFERIAVQLENPILQDVRVRQAILHGIDRETIVDTLFKGLQPVAHGFNSQVSPFYSPDVRHYDYDPEAAKALLAEAGWTPGPDGICVNGDGDRLAIELATTAGSASRETMALVIQSQLAESCIEITPRFVPLQEFNGVLARERQFPGLMMSSINFASAANPRILLGTEGIPNEENNWVGSNFSGYSNPEMDELLEKMESELHPQALLGYWRELENTFAEDLPILPLYFYATAAIMPKNLEYKRSAYDPDQIWANEWVLH